MFVPALHNHIVSPKRFPRDSRKTPREWNAKFYFTPTDFRMWPSCAYIIIRLPVYNVGARILTFEYFRHPSHIHNCCSTFVFTSRAENYENYIDFAASRVQIVHVICAMRYGSAHCIINIFMSINLFVYAWMDNVSMNSLGVRFSEFKAFWNDTKYNLNIHKSVFISCLLDINVANIGRGD